MGCSSSKLDDEEAVQLCKDRKNFIKEAVEHRRRFASGHMAYIQSLRRVSAALRDYVEGDEHSEFLLDSYITPPFTPIKNTNSGFISISSKTKSFSATPVQFEPTSSFKINYYRPGGNPATLVEERPQSPEIGRVETYSPINHYGIDGFFQMQSSPMNSSFFAPSPYNRSNLPPPSPQTSQWDFFWNPFSSLDYYGYPNRSSLDQTLVGDDINGLRQVREEEGIPDLEEETEHEETDSRRVYRTEESAKVDLNSTKEEVLVEDVDDDDDDDCDECDHESDNGTETEYEMRGLQAQGAESVGVSEAQKAGQVEVSNQEKAVTEGENGEETPGFTVYVNRRPTSMGEVIKDLEDRFTVICNAANEVSDMLEASRAQYSSTSNELSAMKMLNPVALIRSASSRSSSSRFFINSSSSRDEGNESSSDLSDESCMFSGSHQATLDRLYAWEKKLYNEVRAGERIRRAYENKFKQLKNQDVKGEDPSAVDKTRAAIRELHTQIKVSIHSVEAVSKRIETLRDEELQLQLLELVQGLAKMWKVMAECHQSQKRTLDGAKLLLAGKTASKLGESKRHYIISATEPHRLARSAANLETELRNWRACFESWITSQRSYVRALTSWLLRCVRCDDMSKLPLSPPRRSSGAPPIFGICIQWSRFLDDIPEIKVLEKLDFFAAGVGSLYAQQLREDSRRVPGGSKRFGSGSRLLDVSGGNMEVVEVGQLEEELMSTEKMAEVAIKVLCAGMSVAVSSLTEFALGSAEKYAELVKQWEGAKWPHNSVEPRM